MLILLEETAGPAGMSVGKVCGCFNKESVSSSKKKADMPSPRLQGYLDDLFGKMNAIK